MIRFLFRSAGFILLATAFSGLVVDGTRSIAAHRILQFSFGDIVAWMAPARYALLFEASAHWPEWAQRLIAGVLSIPGWIATGSLGLLLFAMGRRPAPSIGVLRR